MEPISEIGEKYYILIYYGKTKQPYTMTKPTLKGCVIENG